MSVCRSYARGPRGRFLREKDDTPGTVDIQLHVFPNVN